MSWILNVMAGAVLLTLLAAAMLFYRFADAFFMGEQPQSFSLIAAGIGVTGVAYFIDVIAPEGLLAAILVFEILGALMTLVGFVLGYRSSAGDLL